MVVSGDAVLVVAVGVVGSVFGLLSYVERAKVKSEIRKDFVTKEYLVNNFYTKDQAISMFVSREKLIDTMKPVLEKLDYVYDTIKEIRGWMQLHEKK